MNVFGSHISKHILWSESPKSTVKVTASDKIQSACWSLSKIIWISAPNKTTSLNLPNELKLSSLHRLALVTALSTLCCVSTFAASARNCAVPHSCHTTCHILPALQLVADSESQIVGEINNFNLVWWRGGLVYLLFVEVAGAWMPTIVHVIDFIADVSFSSCWINAWFSLHIKED